MQFSRHGIPEMVVSYNGPQYDSCELSKFPKEWIFQHFIPSPRHPQSKGKVESAVKICESIMKKAARGKFDPYLSLLDCLYTPTDVDTQAA